MSTEIAVQEQEAGIAVSTPSTAQMIASALQNGASVEMVKELLAMKREVDADDARKAYNKSFSAFKAESVRIVKNVSVTDGPLKGKRYADLFGVVNAVTPILAKHDLSHSWKLTKDEPAWMEVTCTISHALGHSESVSMGAAPDTGPGRNAIQARGSAKSYLERYTLLAATGLAAADTDDDARGTEAVTAQLMPEPELIEYLESIRNAPTRDALKKAFNPAYKRAQELGDKSAQADIIAAKNKRLETL